MRGQTANDNITTAAMNRKPYKVLPPAMYHRNVRALKLPSGELYKTERMKYAQASCSQTETQTKGVKRLTCSDQTSAPNLEGGLYFGKELQIRIEIQACHPMQPQIQHENTL